MSTENPLHEGLAGQPAMTLLGVGRVNVGQGKSYGFGAQSPASDSDPVRGEVGDLRLYIGPDVTIYGWRCTVAGIPGTWVLLTFGGGGGAAVQDFAFTYGHFGQGDQGSGTGNGDVIAIAAGDSSFMIHPMSMGQLQGNTGAIISAVNNNNVAPGWAAEFPVIGGPYTSAIMGVTAYESITNVDEVPSPAPMVLQMTANSGVATPPNTANQTGPGIALPVDLILDQPVFKFVTAPFIINLVDGDTFGVMCIVPADVTNAFMVINGWLRLLT